MVTTMVSWVVFSGRMTWNTALLQDSTTVVSPRKIWLPSMEAEAVMSKPFEEKEPDSMKTALSKAVSPPSAMAIFRWYVRPHCTWAAACKTTVKPSSCVAVGVALFALSTKYSVFWFHCGLTWVQFAS